MSEIPVRIRRWNNHTYNKTKLLFEVKSRQFDNKMQFIISVTTTMLNTFIYIYFFKDIYGKLIQKISWTNNSHFLHIILKKDSHHFCNVI